MDNDEQRDYAEEAYNEALLKEEHALESMPSDDDLQLATEPGVSAEVARAIEAIADRGNLPRDHGVRLAPDDLRRDIAEAIRGRYYATSGELADVVMDVLRQRGVVKE